ncbi:hypothetical protein WICMUC_001715 [Wickerhamomyces mucosus]|uniref:Ribonuclease n=1 Tax=Wickerhamomyces mucosus TaxID=1378264 RepID=A0A9P8PSP0_9ASCO|nr:hypothetical protein WICMUC_001715 [Wickerhamomyces mucosus]
MTVVLDSVNIDDEPEIAQSLEEEILDDSVRIKRKFEGDIPDITKPKAKRANIKDPTPSLPSDFLPPSIPEVHTFDSTTFITPVPKFILEAPDEAVVLGVDEAGRGPVLGPMVYGISYALKSFESTLKSKYKFADSKTLTDVKRTLLLQEMCQEGSELFENVGWSTRTMTAKDISSGMLRSSSMGNYNLNEQAHDATMDLIEGVLNQKVNVREIYVDTVGPPTSYQIKLQTRFPGIKITVTKKADSLFPIVSTASICAKVTRDISLNQSKNHLYSEDLQWGSGYPSDPKTSKWLNSSVDKLFGWSPMVRYSWQTSKDSLSKNGGYDVEWAEDNLKQEFNVKGFFKSDRENERLLENLDISMLWYGKNVNLL